MAGYNKYQKPYNNGKQVLPAAGEPRGRWKAEYKHYRVKSAIRSFRDLEVYKQTTNLSSEIFNMELPDDTKNKPRLTEEISGVYELSREIPCLIAESYGEKFGDLAGAMQKLETSAQRINMVITKIDFLVASIENMEIKERLNKFLKRYQIQRRKVLNLKNAWQRVFGVNLGERKTNNAVR